MCASQMKLVRAFIPVWQHNISWNVKIAFRTKFPFLLPAVMTSHKGSRPYCSDLSRSGAFDCYFLAIIPAFTREGRTHSRQPHVKVGFGQHRKFLSLGLCPHIFCGLHLGSNASTSMNLIWFPEVGAWIITLYLDKLSYGALSHLI